MKRFGGRFSVGEIRAGLIDGDLIISGIDFDQHRPFLYVFIVVDIYAGDMAADARTDGVKMSVDLCVVSGFVFGEVSPQDHCAGADDDQADEQEEKVPSHTG